MVYLIFLCLSDFLSHRMTIRMEKTLEIHLSKSGRSRGNYTRLFICHVLGNKKQTEVASMHVQIMVPTHLNADFI